MHIGWAWPLLNGSNFALVNSDALRRQGVTQKVNLAGG
jgi:hypothetical protein